MKREIKFRAWDKEKKQMEECIPWVPTDYCATVNPRKLIYMQYTGLLDKNGKKIYESDNLSINYGKESDTEPSEVNSDIQIDEVVFEDGYFVAKSAGELLVRLIDDYVVEVIGNIYENPDMLK